jgi:predicted transcriptional regulator
MGDMPNFERGQIIGARLTGASVTDTTSLLGVSRARVSKVMSAYTNHRRPASPKRNSGRKSTMTERDRRTLRRIISKNQRTTSAQVTGQQN